MSSTGRKPRASFHSPLTRALRVRAELKGTQYANACGMVESLVDCLTSFDAPHLQARSQHVRAKGERREHERPL